MRLGHIQVRDFRTLSRCSLIFITVGKIFLTVQSLAGVKLYLPRLQGIHTVKTTTDSEYGWPDSIPGIREETSAFTNRVSCLNTIQT